MKTRAFAPSLLVGLTLVGLLAAVPLAAGLIGNDYLMTVMTRVVIYAIAAVSLNIVLGYGGLVSLGHAAFIGIGGYAIGILAANGVTSAWAQWPLAVAASAAAAAIIGALSLRTRGVYFIMVTLAFSQMVYFVFVGLDAYGGDDGLITPRSTGLDLSNRTTFYLLCLAILAAAMGGVARLARSRFGLVLRGAAQNERRMVALGFPVMRYRLAAFIISGALCGLAGVLFANHNEFISPSAIQWSQSAELIVMVVLGGMGTTLGPLLGALAFLLAQEALSSVTTYWQLIIGPLILIFVRFAGPGLAGLIPGASADE